MSIVTRPPIPFHGPIYGGLYDETTIEIKGLVPFGAETFRVSLVSGYDIKADRPLHLSVRMKNRVVVRNSMQMNHWGIEEKKGDVFPFIPGKDFTLTIVANPVCYFISVNGLHCWKFSHRLPMIKDSSLSIEGHVSIERIDYREKNRNPTAHAYPASSVFPKPQIYTGTPAWPTSQSYPATPAYPENPSCPTSQSYPATPAYPGNPSCPTSRIYPSVAVSPSRQISSGYVVMGEPSNPTFVPTIVAPPEQNPYSYPSGGSQHLQPVYNPKIPFSYPIPGGLKPGMNIYISGRPNVLLPHDFTINLQSSTSTFPPPDIAFHFGVRFHNRSVVRNARVNGVWEWEETSIPYFPFHPGTEFHLHLLVEHDRYMVAVDNTHFLEFRHRLQPIYQYASALCIEHDVHISSIAFA